MTKLKNMLINLRRAAGRHRRLTGITFAVTGLLIAAVIWHGISWYKSIDVRRYEVTVPKLAPALDGFRIVLLSDLHIYSGMLKTDYYTRIAKLVEAADPELILIAGDTLDRARNDSSEESFAAMTRVLSLFKAPLGVFAVRGNHDVCFELRRYLNATARAGVVTLISDNVLIDTGRGFLSLSGDDDVPYYPERQLAHPPPADRQYPWLYLTHNPSYFYNRNNQAEVTFAGHTHGGQMRLPWIGGNFWKILKPSFIDAGLHRAGDRRLIVGAGLGASSIPIRINCPPEVVIVTLRAPK